MIRVTQAVFTLAPGSDAAIRHGCGCDRVQNKFGRGEGDARRPLFYVAESCRLHNQPSPARGKGDAQGVGA